MDSTCKPSQTYPPSPTTTGSCVTLDSVGSTEVKSPTDDKSFNVLEHPSSPVTWNGPGDPMNPQDWSSRKKWMTTLVASAVTINATFSSSAPSSATERIIEQFAISSEVSYAVTSVYLLGYVFGPFFFGPGSEMLGRKPVLVVTMCCYTLFILGQIFAPDIQTLLVTRFFSGFFASSPLTIGSAILADIWAGKDRGLPSSIFSGSVFLGPALGPLVGGFVAESSLKWNWIFWVMFIFAGASTFIMILLLPESCAMVLLSKKAKRLRKQAETPEIAKTIYTEHERKEIKMGEVIRLTLYRPFQMLAEEPILVLVTAYMSIVYGLLYALFEAFPIIFMDRHGLSSSQNGLIFIGVGIGSTLGAFVNWYLTQNLYVPHYARWKGFPPAEYRLWGAMVGSPALVIGTFWLGWTGNYESISWTVPAVATIMLGFGIFLIFTSFLTYLIDTYLMYSASAFAANTTIRSLVAAAFPLFTVQMFQNLGIGWAASLIGFIALLLAPSPFLFFKYGASIRTKSKFAPCIDLKIAKELEKPKSSV
ncbi:major facilitator superfamily domain-containing protein [Lentinula guzmanii]|uniref:Major facilitator superfamily domain-containing protein n=1 Tax=Lentinula guzmanii TaxID=2804957 RepID=A0AA38J3R5_9AGAR|nr:major facilitator superfamily domain-containing protein [Lentinula guzmanii]